MLENYFKEAADFDAVCLNEEVNNAARFDRMEFEKRFVKEIVPPADRMRGIIALSKQQDTFDQIQELLMETGQREEEKYLKGMGHLMRSQAAPTFRLLKDHMALNEASEESRMWKMLIDFQ